MKKNFITVLSFLIVFLSSCMSPYSKYPAITKIEDLTYPFSTQKLTLSNGISIAYTEQGTGKETIVFIHGLASYMPAWQKNLAELSKYYRCIAIDLPGYGKSSKGVFTGSMEFFAATVHQFLTEKGITHYWLAGHSMGGQISLLMALQYPQEVKGLVLAAPAGFETFNEGEKQWFREVLTAKATALTTPEQIQTNLVSNFYNFPQDAEFMITDRIAMREAEDFDAFCYIIPQSVQGMVNTPVYDDLSKITQPVLVLYGEGDNLIPNRFLHGGETRTVAEKGCKQLKNSKLVMIPKAGHFVQWEGAEVFNKAVVDFIKY